MLHFWHFTFTISFELQAILTSNCKKKKKERILNVSSFIAVVEYKIGGDMGFVRYYLAPKIEDDDGN